MYNIPFFHFKSSEKIYELNNIENAYTVNEFTLSLLAVIIFIFLFYILFNRIVLVEIEYRFSLIKSQFFYSIKFLLQI